MGAIVKMREVRDIIIARDVTVMKSQRAPLRVCIYDRVGASVYSNAINVGIIASGRPTTRGHCAGPLRGRIHRIARAYAPRRAFGVCSMRCIQCAPRVPRLGFMRAARAE